MILWDSRTIHCSTPALVAPTAPTSELLRMAAYVCMTPASWATADVVQARIGAFERNMTTTHWPHLYNYVVPLDKPRVNDVRDTNMTKEKYSLIVGKDFC